MAFHNEENVPKDRTLDLGDFYNIKAQTVTITEQYVREHIHRVGLSRMLNMHLPLLPLKAIGNLPSQQLSRCWLPLKIPGIADSGYCSWDDSQNRWIQWVERLASKGRMFVTGCSKSMRKNGRRNTQFFCGCVFFTRSQLRREAWVSIRVRLCWNYYF